MLMETPVLLDIFRVNSSGTFDLIDEVDISTDSGLEAIINAAIEGDFAAPHGSIYARQVDNVERTTGQQIRVGFAPDWTLVR